MKDYLEKAINDYLRRNNFTQLSITTALIDMDGVLYDSMKNHTAAWARMMTELGVKCDRDEFYLYEGMTGKATINLLFQRAFGHGVTDEEASQLYAKKVKYFRELGTPVMMPNTDKVLEILRSNNIKRILVTGSGQSSLLNRLETDYPGMFAIEDRVTAKTVTHGKPHPEPYLKGMMLAHSNPQQSIVIENAPLGVEAAHKAGCFTIAITTGPIPEQELIKSGADLVFKDMEEFASSLPQLLDLFKIIKA